MNADSNNLSFFAMDQDPNIVAGRASKATLIESQGEMDKEVKRQKIASLWEENVVALVRYATRKLHNPSDAIDVVATAFSKLLKNPSKWDDTSKASLFIWVRNECFHENRGISRYLNKLKSFHVHVLLGFFQRNAPTPVEALEKKETDELLEHALSNLKNKHREVLDLHYIYGLTFPEIAKVLHCTPATAETRCRQAKDKARENYNILMKHEKPF